MNIEEILIIKNGAQSYGVSTAYISQIARVPMLMPLPLRPSGVRGLCAVSGNVVNVVDMNILLGLKEVDYDNEKTRLIILNDKYASATLLVSEVYNTVEVKQENFEEINKKDDSIIGIYKHKDTLVQILSLEVLFSKINKIKIEGEEVKSGKVVVSTKNEGTLSRFLVFSMGNEEFALHIDYLREIILADREFTEIAGTSKEVLGLITLREELLLVIDLRRHYGLTPKDSYKNRILIASHKGKKIGLMVDEIINIKSYADKDIEFMRDSFKDNKIAGVIHEEKSIISFFDAAVLENLFEENNSFIDDEIAVVSNIIEKKENSLEVIVFKLGGKEYSFEVENVAEIIDCVDSTPIAYTDEVIDGIINIRGQIVAIVSLFEILQIPAKINHDSKIIICEIQGIKMGFIVDSVSDILDVTSHDIREQEDDLFSQVLHLNNGKRLVLSMDIEKIMSQRSA
jgi:purine-binding chemotaxis protein CheW